MRVVQPSAASVADEQRRKLQAVLNICQKMNAERDVPALLELIAREAASLMHAERASIFLLDRENNELWSHVALDSPPIRFPAHLGIAGATVGTGKTINVANVREDARFYDVIDIRQGYHTRSLLAVPLRNYRGEITGAFEVLNKHGGGFTTEDEELLKALAAQAAIALESAQMLQQLSRHRDHLLDENMQLWQAVEEKFATQPLLGTSPKMHQVVKLIERIGDTAVDVLITGESGTGKELVARALHYKSRRARHAFVMVNCAALPDGLIETEFFGIEKGTATGVTHRIGKFERANGGTLFLDEIADLSLTAQAKILRVLQERMIERIGGQTVIPVDIRILAATNKDLATEVARGTFREDLYYRLNVIHITTPPLRELQEDIPLLAQHFLSRYCQDLQKEPKQLTPAALKCLAQYAWPGNVRELQNEMKRLVVLAPQRMITEETLSDAIRRGTRSDTSPPGDPLPSLKSTVEALERRLIREALEACHYHQQHTADTLGLSRQGLIKKMRRYGLQSGSARGAKNESTA
jgi:Nif-specific regulatory protein